MIAGMQPKSVLISAVLHVSVFAFLLVGNPFGGSAPPKFDVISVKLATMAPPKKMQQEQPKPKPPRKKKTQKKKKPPVRNPKPKVEKTPVPPQNNEPIVAKEAEQEEEESTFESADTSTTEFSQKVSNAEFSGAFDNPDFTYSDWSSRAFGKIQRNWRNYATATHPLAAVITFRVLKSGRIYGAAIRESSGNAVFDQGCLNAVKRAGMLPPLPPEYQREELGVSLKFPWKPK